MKSTNDSNTKNEFMQKEEIRVIIANSLREEREDSGETQEQFAERLGLNTKTYQNYEQMTTLPTLSKLIYLRKKLYNLPPESILSIEQYNDSLEAKIDKLESKVDELNENLSNQIKSHGKSLELIEKLLKQLTVERG